MRARGLSILPLASDPRVLLPQGRKLLQELSSSKEPAKESYLVRKPRDVRIGTNSTGLALGDGCAPAEAWAWAKPQVSDGSLPLFAVGEPRIELPPGVEGLAGPDPEARRDAHDQRHKVLDHEDREVWAHGRVRRGASARLEVRAGDSVALAALGHPAAGQDGFSSSWGCLEKLRRSRPKNWSMSGH